MITFEQAQEVSHQLWQQLVQPVYPPETCPIQCIGVTRVDEHGKLSSEGEHAVMIYFKGKRPKQVLADRIDGVKILYTFDVGEIGF